MIFPNFSIWRRKKPEVLAYKYQLIDGMEGSTDELYKTIEDELAEREVPGIAITREEFAEGGLLSARRVYLRMRRERFVFDVCSAPYGKAWFYSYRFAEIPACLMLWELLLTLAVVTGIVFAYTLLFGVLWGGVIISSTLIGLVILLRNPFSLGFVGLDDFLMRLPVFGIVYETFLRKETYYREDSRVMFLKLVAGIIVECAGKEMSEKGFEQKPFIDAAPDIHRKLAELLKLPSP